MIKTIEYRHQQKVSSTIGIVRLPDFTPTVVPAGQSAVLEGVVGIKGHCKMGCNGASFMFCFSWRTVSCQLLTKITSASITKSASCIKK